MIRIDEAQQLILRDIQPLPAEELPLRQLVGRVLAEPQRAVRDQPPEANSAMDGYALCWRDAAPLHAGEVAEVELPVARTVSAGSRPGPALELGQAVRVMTGAPVPEGTGLVVQREWTDEQGERVVVKRCGPPDAHVRFAGEDVAAGAPLLAAGTVLGAAHVGLLAGQGLAAVPVRRRPVVAILATGDEVQRPGQDIEPGHIYSSNTYSLAALVEEAGGAVRDLGIARDTPESIRDKLRDLDGVDVLITVGGVSVGDFDYVKQVLDELGGAQQFWKVAMRPGKPNAYGDLQGVRYFGLPGNPVSCVVSFLQYVRPALMALQGREDRFLPTVEAELLHDQPSKAGYLFLYRGVVSFDAARGHHVVRSTGAQGSGILRSLVLANCLFAVPEDRDLVKQGERVRVQLLPQALPAQAEPGLRREAP